MNNPMARLRGWPPLAALLERSGALTSGLWIGLAISAIHFTNGGIEPNWAVHLPAVQGRLGAGDFLLGLTMAGMPLGLWLATFVAERASRRVGLKTVFSVSRALFFLPLVLFAFVQSPGQLFLVTLLVGLGNGAWDVVQNSAATRYEQRRAQRWPLFFAFCFSAGSVGAAGIGWLVRAFDWPIAWHLAIVGAIAYGISWFAGRTLPDEKPAEQPDGHRSASGGWATRRFACVALAAMIPLGAAYTWSTPSLERLGAGGGVGALGIVAFTLMQAAAQLAGFLLAGKESPDTSPGRARLTAMAQVLLGGGVALLGWALLAQPGAAALPASWRIGLAIAGWALIGIGFAPMQSLALSVAAERAGPQQRVAVSAMLARYSYVGVMVSPVIVGAVSGWTGDLHRSLALIIGLCVAVPLALAPAFGSARWRSAEHGTFPGPAEWVWGSDDGIPGVLVPSPAGHRLIPLGDARFVVHAADGTRVITHECRPEGAARRLLRQLFPPSYATGSQVGRRRRRALESVPGFREWMRGSRGTAYAIAGVRLDVLAVECDGAALTWEVLRPSRPSAAQRARRAIRRLSPSRLARHAERVDRALLARDAVIAVLMTAAAVATMSSALGALSVLAVSWLAAAGLARCRDPRWRLAPLLSWGAFGLLAAAGLIVDPSRLGRVDDAVALTIALIGVRSSWLGLRAVLTER
jgi:MFS family permease